MGLKKLVKWVVKLGDGSTVEMNFAQSDRTTTKHRYFPVVNNGPSVSQINKIAKAKKDNFEQLWTISGHRQKN